METTKPVHTLVLDSGAIIKNEPPVSTLLSHSEALVTTSAVLSEIKDATTRSRVETTLKPFLTLRDPQPNSVKFVSDFARRTGDLAVLSRVDIHIIALTYEIECERNGGDWRLRRTPGQKRTNGPPPAKTPIGEPADASTVAGLTQEKLPAVAGPKQQNEERDSSTEDLIHTEAPCNDALDQSVTLASGDPAEDNNESQPPNSMNIPEKNKISRDEITTIDATAKAEEINNESDSDSGGWITPSNLKKKQALDESSSTTLGPEPKTMQVAVLTTDFAMQNVILQVNLNLLSPTLNRVKQLKTYILRCHACFQTTKDMTKQFCPKCGQPSLTRVACSTNANGEFKLHLKKNMQWNGRGDRYSIPKPVHGSANGRVKGGGKGSWGNELILAEDQKEYQRAASEAKRAKERSLMDEDYLPGILTGDRNRSSGKIKVGAGRNINSRKR